MTDLSYFVRSCVKPEMLPNRPQAVLDGLQNYHQVRNPSEIIVFMLELKNILKTKNILRRPADRLVQRVLGSLSSSSLKKPPGRKRKFWTEVVKEDLKTLGVDRQFRRDVRFRRIWNRDEWIDSVQGFAEDREGWTELYSRTAHLDEDTGNRVRRRHQPAN